jgi:hypothetical protein
MLWLCLSSVCLQNVLVSMGGRTRDGKRSRSKSAGEYATADQEAATRCGQAQTASAPHRVRQEGDGGGHADGAASGKQISATQKSHGAQTMGMSDTSWISESALTKGSHTVGPHKQGSHKQGSHRRVTKTTVKESGRPREYHTRAPGRTHVTILTTAHFSHSLPKYSASSFRGERSENSRGVDEPHRHRM